MQQEFINITTPIGRLVSGSCDTPRTEDSDGRPLLIKNGPNAGQPRSEYNIGIAIPKTQQDWKFEPWAAHLLQAASRDFPHLFSAPGQLANPNQKFAWKITDGDSQFPNSKGNRPCDAEGNPGNWVIWFTNGYAPKLYKWDSQQNKAVPLAPGEEIKRGYYIEVFGTIAGNKATGDQSGLYLNLSMVCMRAYGEEIVSGPSLEQAGFGANNSLPVGASTMPVGGAAQVQHTPPPAQQQAQQTPPPAQQQQQAQQTPPPAHDLANGPGNAGTPPPPPAEQQAQTPPPPVVEMLSYGGKTQSRDAWKAAGWNDAQIDANCQKV